MENVEIIKALEIKKDLLRKAYEEDLTALEKVIASFKGSPIDSHSLNNNNSSDSTPSTVDKDYIKKSDRHKIAHVIKTENRFLHVREIAKKLNDLEPKISVEDWIKKISPALSALKSAGTIVKHIVGKSNQNSFWGSAAWLNEDGTISPEHMYDEGQVSKSEKIEI